MKRAGIGLLAVVAVGGMLVGGGIAFRPFLFRETITLYSVLPETPEASAFSRGVQLALEEHGFRAGVFRVRHERVSSAGRLSFHQPPLPPGTVSFPRLERSFPPLSAPGSPLAVRDPGFFRRRTEDVREGRLAADWAFEGGARSVYVLSDSTGYYVSLGTPDSSYILFDSSNEVPAGAFVAAAKKAGLSVAGTETVPAGEFEYRHLAARVARWKTDMVYVDAAQDGARLARDLRARGYRGRILLSSRGAAGGSLPDGTYSTWAIETPPPSDFNAKHLGRFGLPADPNAHRGYADALTYLKAIARKEVRSVADIDAALRSALDSFVECDRFAVYVSRDGRFDLVELLP